MTRFCSVLFGILLIGACAVDEGMSEPGEQGVEPPTDGVPDDAAATQPTYPTQHPRIYLTPNRARLQAALSQGTPAASRFRAKVDQWLGGASIWGFGAWNGALLSQLT